RGPDLRGGCGGRALAAAHRKDRRSCRRRWRLSLHRHRCGPRWITSERIAEAIEAYFAGGYQLRDERTRRLLARSHAGFSVDLDVFTEAEWEADPVRREFLVPRGFGWGVATSIE